MFDFPIVSAEVFGWGLNVWRRFHEISQFDDNKKSCREKLAGHNERRRKTHTELRAEDEQKPPKSRMNGSLLNAMRYSDHAKMSFQGSPNMKHSCSK